MHKEQNVDSERKCSLKQNISHLYLKYIKVGPRILNQGGHYLVLSILRLKCCQEFA